MAAALLQPSAGAMAASGKCPDPCHLGRRRSHHSPGLCRGVSPSHPGIDADHDFQCRSFAPYRTRAGRGAGDADVPAQLGSADMKVMSFHLMPYADLDLGVKDKYRTVWIVLPNSYYDPR